MAARAAPAREGCGNCADCPGVSARLAQAKREGVSRGSMSKHAARSGLQKLQTLMGMMLLLSTAVGSYLLATDRSLWLLAVSHAVGLIIIVVIDLLLGVMCLASSRGAYIPSLAAALLGFVLQLGDVFTAPQYGLTIPYFAQYLFGLWAFDLLLGLQLGIVLVGVLGRPYARSLSRRTRKGRELDFTRRGFLKSLAAIASVIGLGVVVSSIKLPAASSGNQTTTTASGPGGVITNVNNLQPEVPVYFDYPSGYPNMLIKNADGSLTALSLLCTHVCCVCSYDTGTKAIYCPCHGSIFDSKGNVVQGPATSSLPVIELNVDSSGNVTATGVSNPGPCNV